MKRELFLLLELVRWHEECGFGGNTICFSCWHDGMMKNSWICGEERECFSSKNWCTNIKNSRIWSGTRSVCRDGIGALTG